MVSINSIRWRILKAASLFSPAVSLFSVSINSIRWRILKEAIGDTASPGVAAFQSIRFGGGVLEQSGLITLASAGLRKKSESVS